MKGFVTVAAMLLWIGSARADCVARFQWHAPSVGDTCAGAKLCPVPLPTDTLYVHQMVFRWTFPFAIDSTTFVMTKGTFHQDSAVTAIPAYAIINCRTTRFGLLHGERIVIQDERAASLFLTTRPR